jgi:hypothetical protein
MWTMPNSSKMCPSSPGYRYPLLGIDAGEEGAICTSAEAYRGWYQIELPQGGDAWIQAAVPTAYDTVSDGRPSSVRFHFLPAAVPN